MKNLVGDVRGLHGQLHVMNDDEVEAAHRRFLKYADMIWERLLEGEKPEEKQSRGYSVRCTAYGNRSQARPAGGEGGTCRFGAAA